VKRALRPGEASLASTDAPQCIATADAFRRITSPDALPGITSGDGFRRITSWDALPSLTSA